MRRKNPNRHFRHLEAFNVVPPPRSASPRHVTPTSWNDEHRAGLAHPHDGEAMRNYEKGFDYDIVGNLLETKHQAGSTSWKRLYEYESPSTLDSNDMDNRLTKTTVGSDDVVYDYDVHGNMTETAHLSKMEWGFQDQLFASAKQEVNNGDPETTYYVYDAAGQRVRKVTEREDLNGSGDPNRKHERIYLGDFEIYREYENDDEEPVETERKTLHVSDDHSRIALIETKTVDDSQNVSDPQPLVRHQLGDHLNSASLELDETGSIISYEDYYPYGSTSFQAVDSATEVSAKRYRYTGKERDEETGFYYHGARYYAPWLCRWTAPDPAGMVDGVNLYEYVRGNPVKLRDPDGMESKSFEELFVGRHLFTEPAQTTDLPEEITMSSDLFREIHDDLADHHYELLGRDYRVEAIGAIVEMDGELSFLSLDRRTQVGYMARYVGLQELGTALETEAPAFDDLRRMLELQADKEFSPHQLAGSVHLHFPDAEHEESQVLPHVSPADIYATLLAYDGIRRFGTNTIGTQATAALSSPTIAISGDTATMLVPTVQGVRNEVSEFEDTYELGAYINDRFEELTDAHEGDTLEATAELAEELGMRMYSADVSEVDGAETVEFQRVEP